MMDRMSEGANERAARCHPYVDGRASGERTRGPRPERRRQASPPDATMVSIGDTGQKRLLHPLTFSMEVTKYLAQ